MKTMHIVEIGGRWGSVFAFEEAKDAMKAYEYFSNCKQVSMEYIEGEYIAVIGKQGKVAMHAEQAMTTEEYELAKKAAEEKKASEAKDEKGNAE